MELRDKLTRWFYENYNLELDKYGHDIDWELCRGGIRQSCYRSCDNVLAVIHDWGNEPCPHNWHVGGIEFKRQCPTCWAELKEVKLAEK